MAKKPPCWQQDDWTRESNKQGGSTTTDKSPEEARADYEATVRAQLVCLTMCSVRKQCLKMALDTDNEDDWWVWGGYTAAERTKMRDGVLVAPSAANRKKMKMQRVHALLSGDSFDQMGADAGLKAESIGSALKGYIWNLRSDQGDFDLYLPSVDRSSDSVHAA